MRWYEKAALIAVSIIPVVTLTAGAANAHEINKCHAAKQKCVGKVQKGLLACYGKSANKGTVVDSACVDKAEGAFGACMSKAEGKGGCSTTGDGEELEAMIDAFVADAVGALQPSYPDPISGGSRCVAAKTKCVAQSAGALLACHAKASSKGTLSSTCVAKAEARLPVCVGKADGSPPCATTNDAAGLGDEIDPFVDAVVCLLDPTAGTCPTPPQIAVASSDNTQFEATVTFDAPRFATVEAGGETWTQVTVAGLESQIGVPGMPALPSWQRLVAVPRGATVAIEQGGVATIREIRQLKLYPFQKEAADGPVPSVFADKPFVKDAQAYATDAFFPPTPCAVAVMGTMRDLEIAQVQCTAAQYNPVSEELRIFDSARFKLSFQGGTGTFLTSQSLSPFEAGQKAAASGMLNKPAIFDFVEQLNIPKACAGEELLILTHPDFRNAADVLATWKRKKGIATTIVNVGLGTDYDDASKIIDLIHGRYDTCFTRVSYVLIIGDAEFVPPADVYYETEAEPDDTTGSDWGYATYPHLQLLFLDATFPYFSVGRIPVDTPGDATTVIDKIVQYESTPPLTAGPFYDTASIASQFQCCAMNVHGDPEGAAGTDQRNFIHVSELVHDALVTKGYQVERIYTETVDNGGRCNVEVDPCPPADVIQPYNGDTTPTRYRDGTLLPKALRASSAFAWSGSTADITDAFNDGRFLIIHRDHGFPGGWADPPFYTSDVAGLSNGSLLPVVYSINCKSAYWDKETDTLDPNATESFMELLLTASDGMVSGIGDVRNSPTWANSALLRGLADATWPDVASEFGDTTRVRRLGDILSHGKRYLATQVGVAQPGAGGGLVNSGHYVDEMILYHVIGDPTLEMWTRNPWLDTLSTLFEAVGSVGGLQVDYAVEGAEITALQPQLDGSMRPVARGTVQNGVATLPYLTPDLASLDPAGLSISASLPDAVSVQLQAPTRFIDNGDGTVTDTVTGLQWEKKTDDGGPHDKDDPYQWAGRCSLNTSKLCQPTAAAEALCKAQTPAAYWANGCEQCAGGDGACTVNAPNLTTVWDWLDGLRTNNFAGHADWRLPSEDGCNTCYPAPPTHRCACGTAELESILLEPYPCSTDPCIAPEFGPTQSSFYWASSTEAATPVHAWNVFFQSPFGSSGLAHKGSTLFVRAVRTLVP